MKLYKTINLGVSLMLALLAPLLFLVPLSATAAMTNIIEETPASTENMWKYSTIDGTDSIDLNYVPTLSEFEFVTPLGYVSGVLPSDPFDVFAGSGNDYDRFLFSTYITSDNDQSITIVINGDDGHSLYVDGVLPTGGGGGFGVDLHISLNLTANVPVKLDFLGANSGGGWAFGIGYGDRLGGGYIWPLANLRDISGITMNAEPETEVGQPFAYVTNQTSNTVSVIDTATNTVIDTVAVGEYPIAIAITPDGAFAYVTNLFTNNVSVIDTTTNTVVTTVPVGSNPDGIAITPDGTAAYVANSSSNTVSIIDTTSNSVATTVPVGSGPWGIAITPDGAFAYVVNGGSHTVSVIDTATNTVTKTVAVGGSPVGVAITPDGAFAYITNAGSNTVLAIDTATNTVTYTAQVYNAWNVAITPDGAFAYITKNTSGSLAGVTVIDTTSNSVATTVPVGSGPSGIAITPDGAFAYVTNNLSYTVSVIDTTTNTVVTTVPVGSNPSSIAITPAAPPVILTFDDATTANLNPYSSDGYTLQPYRYFSSASRSPGPFTANVNRFVHFNDGEEYLTMNFNPDGGVVMSNDSGALFDIKSLDLGSGALGETVDVTVTGLHGAGNIVASATFNGLIQLTNQELSDFTALTSLEISAVTPGTTTATRFSIDNIQVKEVVLVDSDEDGLHDLYDLCTGTAVTDLVDANGCSDLQVDQDSDGYCNPGAPSDGPSACIGTDNCPAVANPLQTQTGNNVGGQFGDACVNPNVNIPDDAIIAPDVEIVEGARIGKGITVGAGSVIGADAKVEDGATVGENVDIGPDAIVSKGATVGDDTIIEMDAKVSKGAIIGVGVTIGIGAIIKDGAVIGDFTVIAAGVTVGKNAQIGMNATINGDVSGGQVILDGVTWP